MQMAYKMQVSILVLVNIMFGFNAPVVRAKQSESEKYIVRQRLESGTRLVIRCPSGSVEVMGWEGDELEASAERNGEPAPVEIQRDGSGGYVISAVFGRRRSESESSARLKGVSSAAFMTVSAESDRVIRLKIPNSVEVKEINVGSSNMTISDLKMPVGVTATSGDIEAHDLVATSIKTGSGDIEASRIGPLSVKTSSGDLDANNIAGSLDMQTYSGDATVSNISGSVAFQSSSGDMTASDIGGDFVMRSTSGNASLRNVLGNITFTATSGDFEAKNVGRDVKVYTLSGDVDVHCAKGRVDATCVSGSITLVGIGGDVEAKATSGDISFAGALREDGRYTLKALSGGVKMGIPADTSGFQATLACYSGTIETQFNLAISGAVEVGAVNKRIIGQYGNGRAQLTLDSFSGEVRLLKSSSVPNCQDIK